MCVCVGVYLIYIYMYIQTYTYVHTCTSICVRDYRTQFQNKKKNLTQKAKFFFWGECRSNDKVAGKLGRVRRSFGKFYKHVWDAEAFGFSGFSDFQLATRNEGVLWIPASECVCVCSWVGGMYAKVKSSKLNFLPSPALPSHPHTSLLLLLASFLYFCGQFVLCLRSALFAVVAAATFPLFFSLSFYGCSRNLDSGIW